MVTTAREVQDIVRSVQAAPSKLRPAVWEWEFGHINDDGEFPQEDAERIFTEHGFPTSFSIDMRTRVRRATMKAAGCGPSHVRVVKDMVIVPDFRRVDTSDGVGA